MIEKTKPKTPLLQLKEALPTQPPMNDIVIFSLSHLLFGLERAWVLLLGSFEHVLCLLSIQNLYDALLDDCYMLCAGLLLALVAVLSTASGFVFFCVFLGCQSYCLISKFVLWGILSIQFFLVLFFLLASLVLLLIALVK